ncbi:MAG: DUF371 domain-containing protein [Methanobacteriaceae archaeon]
MEHVFFAKGHPNVTSTHKTTFEVTKDKEIGKTADCIIGVAADDSIKDIPQNIRKAISRNEAVIKIYLETENAADTITGKGDQRLTLDHPTDIVCRKSDFICDRTLMIKADKAAKDLNPDLIKDLRAGKQLKVKISVK